MNLLQAKIKTLQTTDSVHASNCAALRRHLLFAARRVATSCAAASGWRRKSTVAAVCVMRRFLLSVFRPKEGMAKDPVTGGSDRCALAPYFGVNLGKQCRYIVGLQKAFQASEAVSSNASCWRTIRASRLLALPSHNCEEWNFVDTMQYYSLCDNDCSCCECAFC